MKRIHLLLPDVNVAERVVHDLLLAHVDWHDLHILASPKISLANLPDSNLAQNSDLLPALARGTAAGGLTGMLAGLVAVTFPLAGLTIAGGEVLALTLGGAGFGAWMAGMIGVSLPNSRLERFEEAISRGELLLLVDVSREREEEIKSIIRAQYAAADFHSSHPSPTELVA